jgi:hypothetical protein
MAESSSIAELVNELEKALDYRRFSYYLCIALMWNNDVLKIALRIRHSTHYKTDISDINKLLRRVFHSVG